MSKIGISIVGGTGYGASEALRLCAQHPELDVVSVVSASAPGVAIAEVHPHLASLYSGSFVAEIDFAALETYEHRAVLLALPHGTAASYVRSISEALRAHEVVLFDLSGDFRLASAPLREQYYPGISDAEQSAVVYGLPELNRKAIGQASQLSTPGCLASVVTLAALPLFRSTTSNSQRVGGELPKVEGLIVADAKTGTSGAGKTLAQAFHHPSRHDNANAYKVLVHRHEPEILQNWGISDAHSSNSETLSMMFVPHVIPCSRGCMATVYCELQEAMSQEALEALYADFYKDEPFIRLRHAAPQLGHVVGSNFCDISVVIRGRQVVALAALDNLVKGAAGQALQNINIRFGLDELLGLSAAALGPSA